MREKLRLHGSLVDAIVQMSEGNPGATTVLARMLKDRPDDGFMLILGLDDMNMRGSQIWLGYKDHCHQDLGQFISCIQKRDPEMVLTVNRESCDGESAVEHGGSWAHK